MKVATMTVTVRIESARVEGMQSEPLGRMLDKLADRMADAGEFARLVAGEVGREFDIPLTVTVEPNKEL